MNKRGKIKDQLKEICEKYKSEILSTSQIKDLLHKNFSTNVSSVLPSDYCYNRINLNSSGYYFFERVDQGKFKYLGEDYPYTGEIIWHQQGNEEKIVGYWQNGKRIQFIDIMKGTEDKLFLLQSESETDSYNEGGYSYRLHRQYERDGDLPKEKKFHILNKTGKLACEACDFNFNCFYGSRGEGFIECHHNKPISEMKEKQKVSIDDLSLLCSNCHKIIHRSRPWISVDDLRNIINKEKNNKR